MLAQSTRHHRRVTFLALVLILLSLLPTAILAQTPEPSPVQQKPPVEAFEPSNDLFADPPADPEVETPPVDEGALPSTEEESAPAKGEPETVGGDEAPSAPESPTANPVQGVVQLNVTAPDDIRAGEIFTYTYIYTNTSDVTINTVRVDASWAPYAASSQACEFTPCRVAPGSVAGPAVSCPAPCSVARFELSNLGPHSGGRFSIRMKSHYNYFPVTNQPPKVLSGSGSLFINGGITPISEDTAETTVVGPVFYLKKVADSTNKIFPTKNGTFTISLGNATNTNDKDPTGGNVRTDARPATNIVLLDTIPQGSEFVPALSTTSPYSPTLVGSGSTRQVRWDIPGPLVPGQTINLKLAYKKLDEIVCDTINNSTLTVTSAEMPWSSQTTQLSVKGTGASINVQDPMLISKINVVPLSTIEGSPYFGDQAKIEITVQNYWPEFVTGAILNYDIQSNAFYVLNTASSPNNVEVTEPADPSQPGGRVSWKFNMLASTKNTSNQIVPSERTFSLIVHGMYTDFVANGTGRASLVTPDGVPGNCIPFRDGRAVFKPRIKIKKYTEEDTGLILDGAYIVEEGYSFEYIVEVQNFGTTTATDLAVIDNLPSAIGADFRFDRMVQGPAPNPNKSADGFDGLLVWDGITLSPNEKLILRYRLIVQGLDFVKYCNLIVADMGPEETAYSGSKQVCVKINPHIALTKVGNKTDVQPGEEITYTLRLTNYEPTAYVMGILDKLPAGMTFVRHVSPVGYLPEYITHVTNPDNNPSYVYYPLEQLSANGGSVEVTLVARVSSACVTKTYRNEMGFHTDEWSAVYQRPAVIWDAKVVCGKIEYSKKISSGPSTVGLGEVMGYTLTIKNTDGRSYSNIEVKDILPPGFSYVGMETSGTSYFTPPYTKTVTEDGRQALFWKIPSLSAAGSTLSTVNIKFKARTGAIVGTFTNMMRIITAGGKCVGRCLADPLDGEVYSAVDVTVKPLLTTVTKIDTTACADPGDMRRYTISLLSTNTQLDYTSIAVTLTLPLGLKYMGMVQDPRNIGQKPMLNALPNGRTQLIWRGITVLKATTGFNQTDIMVRLGVGQVYGHLDTSVNVTTPIAIVPRDDVNGDPAVPVCTTGPAIAKEVDIYNVAPGGQVMYTISLVNPNGDPYAVSFKDELPEGFSLIEMISGPVGPAVSTNDNGRQELLWDNLVLPAAGAQATVYSFVFMVQVSENFGLYVNNAEQIAGNVLLNNDYASASVLIAYHAFVPFIENAPN